MQFTSKHAVGNIRCFVVGVGECRAQFKISKRYDNWDIRYTSTKFGKVCIEDEFRGWIDILYCTHDDVIKWKHFPRYWSFVRGIHRSPVNSPHKSQWRGALMYIINGWVNNGESGDLRRHRAHYHFTVIWFRHFAHPGDWLMTDRVELVRTITI